MRARCRVPYLRPKMRLLLRSRKKRVLPPGPSQLLLRPVGGVHVPSHRGATKYSTGCTPAPGHLVRLHGAHYLPRPQNLRAVAVRREEAVVQGGKPFLPPIRRGQLCGGYTGREGRVGGSGEVPVGDWVRPLPRRVRDIISKAPHE